MNYKLRLSICIIGLLIGCPQTFAETDDHHALKHYEPCLSSKIETAPNGGSWSDWCLPATKPDTADCTTTRWNQTKNLTNLSRC